MKTFFLLSFLFGMMIVSCNENSTSNNNDSKMGTINGIVLTKSGLLLSGVEIYTVPPTEVKISNSSGQFMFEKVPVGTYNVFAKKNNYRTKFVTINIISNKKSEATIILEETASSSENHPPSIPNLISPLNNSNVSGTLKLKWECSDPDGDDIIYNVYLGENTNSLNVVGNNTTANELEVKNLTKGLTYYWKVIASDTEGESSTSEIRSFKITELNDNSKLLLQLNFDGNTNDISTYEQTSYPTEITFTKDRYGNTNSAAYFKGSSFIEVTNLKSMDFNKPFSVSLWVKPDNGYGIPYDEEVDLLGRYGPASPNKSSFALSIKNGYLKAEIYNYNYKVNDILFTDSWIEPNLWKQLVMIYNGSELILYVNGQRVGQKIILSPDTSDLSLFIGKRSVGNRIYKGAIDDLMIFNYALTDNDVKDLYQ